MSTASATPATPSTDMVGQLLSQALTGAFDSLKDKVTANVQENGEQYLHQAVEKIKDATSGVVAWAKENPVKTALAIAALAAVTTFLVKTMSGPSEAGADDKSDKDAGSAAKAKAKSESKSKAKPRTMSKSGSTSTAR